MEPLLHSQQTRNPLTVASIISLPTQQRKMIMGNLTTREKAVFSLDWLRWARAEQLPPPGQWDTWLALAGRGWGKTRTGAEWIRSHIDVHSMERVALVGATSADVRDVMVEGPSGILSVFPKWDKPDYEPSKRKITFGNGATAHLYSAEEPNRLRGPEHDGAWGDEIASWRYIEAWDNLQFGLRRGLNPRQIITTTPKPTRLIKDLVADPDTVITGGSTYENAANLAPAFLKKIRKKYEGTRIGQQELHAKLLKDVPGALWHHDDLDITRIRYGEKGPNIPDMVRIVVAVDPPVTQGPDADECGIIVVGLGTDGRFYVLDDKSCQGLSPNEWARIAVIAYHHWKADRIIAEVNNGGDLVEAVVRTVDKNVSYRKVWASRGKVTRAEPIAALYEQKRVSHVGTFANLEEQMCEFTTDFDKATMGYSPDRVDALVWALTALDKGGHGGPRVRSA